jgi:hypothetical protein
MNIALATKKLIKIVLVSNFKPKHIIIRFSVNIQTETCGYSMNM